MGNDHTDDENTSKAGRKYFNFPKHLYEAVEQLHHKSQKFNDIIEMAIIMMMLRGGDLYVNGFTSCNDDMQHEVKDFPLLLWQLGFLQRGKFWRYIHHRVNKRHPDLPDHEAKFHRMMQVRILSDTYHACTSDQEREAFFTKLEKKIRKKRKKF